MKREKLFIFILFFLFISYVTTSGREYTKLTGDDAVNSAISDFIKTSKLIKKLSTFSILITDIDNGILIIGIVEANDKIYPRESNKVGTYDDIFPTKYKEVNNKLFYWNDSTQVITQEIIDVLEKYNHIDFDWSKEYAIPPIAHDDGQEGMVYYFCKDDYKKYKKTKASTIKKHYNPPKLKCNSLK